MRAISLLIYWLSGWKVAGEVPPLKKFVIIGAPHTSAWDAVYGIAATFILRVPITFIGKQEAFRFPAGILLRYAGGIPVDRFASHNVVDFVVKLFEQHEEFYFALAPEGTRQYAPEWRTGFYYIALKARVPIVLGYMNYETKTAGIGPLFYPTGDIEKDIAAIKEFYKPIKGKHPELGVR